MPSNKRVETSDALYLAAPLDFSILALALRRSFRLRCFLAASLVFLYMLYFLGS